MTPELIGLFAQIPLVGIFVWFTLTMFRHNTDERTIRDKEWREFLTARNGDQIEAMRVLTGEIHSLSAVFQTNFAALQSSVQEHDHRAELHMAMAQERLANMTESQSKRPSGDAS